MRVELEETSWGELEGESVPDGLVKDREGVRELGVIFVGGLVALRHDFDGLLVKLLLDFGVKGEEGEQEAKGVIGGFVSSLMAREGEVANWKSKAPPSREERHEGRIGEGKGIACERRKGLVTFELIVSYVLEVTFDTDARTSMKAATDVPRS
jgi:hypothetical protein